jgi:hypothetical protein
MVLQSWSITSLRDYSLQHSRWRRDPQHFIDLRLSRQHPYGTLRGGEGGDDSLHHGPGARASLEEIRVNAIAPGSIEFPGGMWERRKTLDPKLYNAILRSNPLGRLGCARRSGECGPLSVERCGKVGDGTDAGRFMGAIFSVKHAAFRGNH